MTDVEFITNEKGVVTKVTKRNYTLSDGSNYTKTNVQHNEPSLKEVSQWFNSGGHKGRLDC